MYTLYSYIYISSPAYFINFPDSEKCGYVFTLPLEMKSNSSHFFYKRYIEYHDLEAFKKSSYHNQTLKIVGTFDTRDILDEYLRELDEKLKVERELMR